uniref:Endonuclease/exonuclease/phosphatase domain-containing protein n=1 Tax=Octopus bimaculoides TaxID=37653 RepID=A0A0L8FT94_OCTBM
MQKASIQTRMLEHKDHDNWSVRGPSRNRQHALDSSKQQQTASTLSEHCNTPKKKLLDSGTLHEKDYTFFWQGKGTDEIREHGVSFAVKNSLLKLVKLNSDGSEWILSLLLHTFDGPVNLISAYAPILYSSQDAKDKFYDQLSMKIQAISNGEQLVLLGDFNTRVGADHDYRLRCLGQYGVGNMNENGQWLLELSQHRISWSHPHSGHWHQLDLIITRPKHLRNVHLIQSFQSADYDIDHCLVCCNLKSQPKVMHNAKLPGKQHINITTTQQPTKIDTFLKTLENALLADPSKDNVQQR